MRPVLPVKAPLALFDAAGTREIEQRAAASFPPHGLMRRAGESIARLALAVAPHAEQVWIAAGPGNNGGDGLEAAMHLLRAGKRVEVSLLADAASLPNDAADALQRAQAAGVAITTSNLPSTRPQLAIDALLGLGASRSPNGALASAIRALNALPCPVLAVDLPSGLHSTTGQLLGADGVTASHTLALLTLKPGLFTGAGRDHAGEVWFDSLEPDALSESPIAWLTGTVEPAPRRHAQHKGSFGDVATTAEVQADRLKAARELVDRFACTTVLKGSGSVIAAPGNIPYINSTGNAALASAGTGDVLAGWLGGRWAACPPEAEATTAFTVAVQAVAEHGAAAEPPPLGALRAADLIERLCSLGGMSPSA